MREIPHNNCSSGFLKFIKKFSLDVNGFDIVGISALRLHRQIGGIYAIAENTNKYMKWQRPVYGVEECRENGKKELYD